jgi:hypothetical protein
MVERGKEEDVEGYDQEREDRKERVELGVVV